MNKLLRSLLAVALLGVASLAVQAQPAPKILVIDMAKLYESHFKTEDHITKLRAARTPGGSRSKTTLAAVGLLWCSRRNAQRPDPHARRLFPF